MSARYLKFVTRADADGVKFVITQRHVASGFGSTDEVVIDKPADLVTLMTEAYKAYQLLTGEDSSEVFDVVFREV